MTLVKRHRLGDERTVFYRTKTELEILRREFDGDRLYDEAGIRIESGDCVFDVGANLGFFLLQLNRQVSAARVFCFEPIPDTFELLRLNAAENDRLNAELFNCGLSDQAGTATFAHQPLVSVASSMCRDDSRETRRNARKFVYEEMRTRSPLLRLLTAATPRLLWWPLTEIIRRLHDRPVAVRCRVRTLSDVVDERRVERIDLLKIDVEGAEQAVLDGLREEHWPRVRQIVLETHRGRAQAEHVAGQLQARGFRTRIRRSMHVVDHLHMIYARRR